MNESQQFKPVNARHVDVRDQTMNLFEIATLEQCRGGGKQAHGMARRFQKILKRLENSAVIIDHCNDEWWRVVSHAGIWILPERYAAVSNRKM
jgi:hypothetical protein